MCSGRLLYEWEQDLSDVHMYIAPPPQVKAKEIQIQIHPNRLRVGLIGKPPLFDVRTILTSTHLSCIHREV